MAQSSAPINTLQFILSFYAEHELDNVLVAQTSKYGLRQGQNRPGTELWTARHFLKILPTLDTERNSYWISSGLFNENDDWTEHAKQRAASGSFFDNSKKTLRWSATYDNQTCVRILNFDDIGSKFPESGLPFLVSENCACVESSDGNHQMLLKVDLSREVGKVFNDIMYHKRPAISDPGAFTVPRWSRLPVGINGKYDPAKITRGEPKAKFPKGEVTVGSPRSGFKVKCHYLPGRTVTQKELFDEFSPGTTEVQIKQSVHREQVTHLGGRTGEPTLDPILQAMRDHRLIAGDKNKKGWEPCLCPERQYHSDGNDLAGYNTVTRRVSCFHSHSNAPAGHEEITSAYLTKKMAQLGRIDYSNYPLEQAISELPAPAAANRCRVPCVYGVLYYDYTPAEALEEYQAMLREGDGATLLKRSGEDFTNHLISLAGKNQRKSIDETRAIRMVKSGTAYFTPKQLVDRHDLRGNVIADERTEEEKELAEAPRKQKIIDDHAKKLEEYVKAEIKRKAWHDKTNAARRAAHEKKLAQPGIKNAKNLQAWEVKDKKRRDEHTGDEPYVPLKKPRLLTGRNLAEPTLVNYKPLKVPTPRDYEPLVVNARCRLMGLSQPELYVRLATHDWLRAAVPFGEVKKALQIVGLWSKRFGKKLRWLYDERAKRGALALTGAMQVTHISPDLFDEYDALAIKAQPGFGKTEVIIRHALANGLRIAYIVPLTDLARAGSVRMDLPYYQDNPKFSDKGIAVCCASMHKPAIRKAILSADIVVFDELACIFDTLYSVDLQNAELNNLALSVEWMKGLLRREHDTTNPSDAIQQHLYLDASLDDFSMSTLQKLSGAAVPAVEVPECWGARELHGKHVNQRIMHLHDAHDWLRTIHNTEGSRLVLADDVKLVDSFGAHGRFSSNNRPPANFGTQYCLDIEREAKKTGGVAEISTTPVLGRGIDLNTGWSVFCVFAGQMSADGAGQLFPRERHPKDDIVHAHFKMASATNTRTKHERHLEAFNKAFPDATDEYTSDCLAYAQRGDWLRAYGAAGLPDRLAATGAKVLTTMHTLPQCRDLEYDEAGKDMTEEKRRGVIEVRVPAMAGHTPDKSTGDDGRGDFKRYIKDMGTLAFHRDNPPPARVAKALKLPKHYTPDGKDKRCGGDVKDWMLWWCLNGHAFRAANRCWNPEAMNPASDISLITKTGMDSLEIARMQKALMLHLLGAGKDLEAAEKKIGELQGGVVLAEDALDFLKDEKSDLFKSLPRLSCAMDPREKHTDRRLKYALNNMGMRITTKRMLKENRAGVWSVLYLRERIEIEKQAAIRAMMQAAQAKDYGTPALWGNQYRYDKVRAGLDAAKLQNLSSVTISLEDWSIDGGKDLPRAKRKEFNALRSRVNRKATDKDSRLYGMTITQQELTIPIVQKPIVQRYVDPVVTEWIKGEEQSTQAKPTEVMHA